MGDAQTAARHQQHIEELCAASIPALAGEGDLHFRGRRLHRGRKRLPLFAPHLHPSLDNDDFDSFRGAADGLALRLRLSNAALYRAAVEREALDPVARTLFDMLEQFRVESQAGDEWPGVRHNLRHRFAQWLLAFHRSGLTESARGILLFTVAQVCRARVTREPLLEETEDLMETTRAGIAPAIGHALAGLRRTRGDQAAYAEHALDLARWVAEQLRAVDERDGENAAPLDGEEQTIDDRFAFGMRMEREDGDLGDEREGAGTVVTGRERTLGDGLAYRVFTTAYDREVRAATQVRKEQLDEFRTQLDRRIASQGLNVAKLARELKALLAAPHNAAWVDAQEEGLIDGRRLAQLIASPAERRLFRQYTNEPRADAVVGFLIDCSGSMRVHIEGIAALVDVFARALELAGMASEVLGFTTGAWHGGRAQRDWVRAGKPPNPGRLNETLRLVVKDADTPWRRARRDIAALLDAKSFREGIDGEALAWAAERLRARAEHRRILIVVSDGCPMDGATQLANQDVHLLDRHLCQVAADIEGEGVIELCAVAPGLDLSAYYARSQVLDTGSGIGNRSGAEIVALMAGRARR